MPSADPTQLPQAPGSRSGPLVESRRALTSKLKAEALELGFDAVGVTAVRPSEHAAFYRAWLDAGHHGELEYLARDDAVERRLHPERAWPELRSAIVVAMRYAAEEATAQSATPLPTSPRWGEEVQGRGAPPSSSFCEDGLAVVEQGRGSIARYARGRDYHRVLRKRLLALLERAEHLIGHELPAARAYVDTGPVLERELARRAGLGWFGRNTMLIHPRRGSYFFLGSLLLEVELDEDPPFDADHCGRCTACIDACPTGALLGRDATGAPVMDATRCISYLTIELRGPIPRDLRPLIGNRIFGCDICQEACPFNRKSSTPSSEPAFALLRGPSEPPAGVDRLPSDGSHPGTASPSLIDLMSMEASDWEAFSRGSALRRAGRAGFRRNVAVALGNWGDEAAVPALKSGLFDSDPLVRSHSAWALGRVGSTTAVAALRAALSAETDQGVIDEIELALKSKPDSRNHQVPRASEEPDYTKPSR